MEPIVNVYVLERNGEEHQLVEKEPRNAAVDALNEAFLENGVVPPWVKSVTFYEDGDQPTEEYGPGEHIA